MSDVELYLLKFDRNKEESSAVAKATAQKLETKEVKLLTLIESLGEFLNSDDASTREKTLSFVAEVLEATPPKTLTGQQRNLLCDFLSSRIADESATLPICARALLALNGLGPWEPEKAALIMNNVLQHTHPLSQYRLQSERYPVLQLIDTLLSKYRKVLLELHDSSQDFMTQFIAYFDGEKDPRNLMIVFSILRVPMTEWDIHKHSQDLFDAVFNYFPITFRPPPNDPYGITAQDLKDRLRHCIAASAELAPYAFPALLDKLDSTSINVKRDVLQTIDSCVDNYGPQTISLYSVTLWDALKFEILQVQEEDLAQEALKALTGIAQQLSHGSAGALSAYLKPIAKEANEHLEDAPTKQSQAAGRILEQVASASASSSNFLAGAVLPTLLALYESANSVAKRRGLTEVLDGLLRANATVFGEWKSTESFPEATRQENALQEHRVQILDLLVNEIAHTPQKEVSFRLAALNALTNMMKIRNILDGPELSKAITLMDEIVLNEESYGNDDVKTAAIKSLVSLAQQRPQLVIDTAFPQFLAKLPDTDQTEPGDYVFVLEAFVQMAAEPQVFPTIAVRLKNKLNAALHQGASAKFIQAILAAMLYAFSHESVDLKGTTTSCPYYEDLISPLLQQASTIPKPGNSALRDEGALELVGKLANVVVRQQTAEFQESLVSQLYSFYRSVNSNLGANFDNSSPEENEKLLILSTYLLASLRREVSRALPLLELLGSLKIYAQRENTSVQARQACIEQIALITNKTDALSNLASVIDQTICPQELLRTNQVTDIKIAFAVAKALLLRNAAIFPSILQALLQALPLIPQGLTIAHGFATLLQPDEILRKENHCIVSALHKQKVFNLVISDISTNFPSADPVLKKNYLIALASVLQHLQYAVVEPHLATLVPLILQMLDLRGEHVVKAAAIDSITAILTQQPKPLEEHTSSLTARLLACTTASAAPSNVRARALQALALIPIRLKREAVIPFRRQVIKRLTEALDDKKRDVRSEAVKCRTRWIELDEAGDDDE